MRAISRVGPPFSISDVSTIQLQNEELTSDWGHPRRYAPPRPPFQTSLPLSCVSSGHNSALILNSQPPFNLGLPAPISLCDKTNRGEKAVGTGGEFLERPSKRCTAHRPTRSTHSMPRSDLALRRTSHLPIEPSRPTGRRTRIARRGMLDQGRREDWPTMGEGMPEILYSTHLMLRSAVSHLCNSAKVGRHRGAGRARCPSSVRSFARFWLTDLPGG